MKFIVQGRTFTKRLHAVAFAEGMACETGNSVDVKVETRDGFNRVHRSWACRIHPPGMLRTLLKKPAIASHIRAVG